MAVASCLMFILGEAAVIGDPQSAGATVNHQLPLFGAILAASAGFYVAYSVGYRYVERAVALSLTDPLTRLSNRRAFEERVTIALERHEPFSVAYADLDGFKRVNDTAGHAAGDAVLRKAAEILQRAARRVDTIARLGGDEFGLVLMGAGEAQARIVVERLLAAWREQGLPVGISVGIATNRDGASRTEIIAAADAAMYRAKVAGGNRVGFASEPSLDAAAADLLGRAEELRTGTPTTTA